MSENEPTGEVVYIVQRARDTAPVDPEALWQVWEDIATVTVPPRTKRATVIKKALAEVNLQPNEDGSAPRLRALDAESAEVHEPEAYQPPMEWRL